MFNAWFEKAREAWKKFSSNRILVIGAVFMLLLLIVVIRLFSLQILKSSLYSDNYLNTTKKEVSIQPLRGNIYDRNGKLLAGNRKVCSIGIRDLNYYAKGTGEFNEMLLSLIHLMGKYNTEVSATIPVVMDGNGQYVFSGAQSKIKTFIRDVYGKKTIEKSAEQGIDIYSYDAETVMAYLMKNLYNFSAKWKNAESVSKEDALSICHIRYGLAATAYTRYIATVVAFDITEELQAAILENSGSFSGVTVEETYERVYYNSECFSCILGYVGSATQEEIEELNSNGGNYIAGDIVGKQGIESAYESYLQGEKGTKILYVDSLGMVLSEEPMKDPVPGNDLYLSIDADLTVAAYNITEQQLSGILVGHLYAGTDYDPEEAYRQNDYRIPIRDVYFQMINNNILSMENFTRNPASEEEREMEEARGQRKSEIIAYLNSYLKRKETGPLVEQDKYLQAYIRYFYTYLVDLGYLKKESIDTSKESYRDWASGNISFPTFLTAALSEGWADMSKIESENRYNSVEECYNYLIAVLLDGISEKYGAFDKLIYDELIHKDRITGCQVGLALFYQGILKEDPEAMASLKNGTSQTAYDFFVARISSMELTPAQIALDPCSAGMVLTNPNSGEYLAVISYPGYDLNQINNPNYYRQLLNDLSSPLYSRATQTRLAPGSTFKMITAIAALEGGYYQLGSQITCNGIFDKLDNPRCWIYRLQNSSHGAIDIVHALAQSCNCFFYECGYRFSLNSNQAYSPSQGISVLTEYAKKFGFGSLTGIETAENVSVITNELPVTSAIGQGTNAFTTISLARYVTAIASNGKVYECKLMKKIANPEGQTLLSYQPKILEVLQFRQSTWNAIHNGMYMVVHEGGSRNGDFNGLQYQYAAKSGSAQENRLRPEHGWYVTYGPYDNIQWAMAVQIPNGYSAGNAALIAKGVYEYLEGGITLEEILSKSASESQANTVGD